MEKIMHRDGKNSNFTAIFHPIAMHSSFSQPESYELLTGKL